MTMQLNGKITMQDLINKCNEKWLKFDRMKSSLNEQGIFTPISNYSCKLNISQHKINESFPVSNKKACNSILSNYSNKANSKPFKFNDKPMWEMILYQYTNVSLLLFSVHHCIGDGNTFYELLKRLCDLPSNLSNNTQLKNEYKNISILHKIYNFIKFIYNAFRYIKKFLFQHILKYYYNKIMYSNKVYMFEPKNGLSVCNIHVLYISLPNITDIHLYRERGGQEQCY